MLQIRRIAPKGLDSGSPTHSEKRLREDSMQSWPDMNGSCHGKGPGVDAPRKVPVCRRMTKVVRAVLS